MSNKEKYEDSKAYKKALQCKNTFLNISHQNYQKLIILVLFQMVGLK